MTGSPVLHDQTWPRLPLEQWTATYATLHLWLQIVGKIRLRQSPWMNHCWTATFYVTPRGLTTSAIPYGARQFEIEFDFIGHHLTIRSSDGQLGGIPLETQSVAAFYRRLMNEMARLDLQVTIHKKPNEVPDPILFDKDEAHATYNAEQANRFWQILVQVDRVLKQFRSRFMGKCSPVHFFWGAPDLAVTRFSGRPAPEHPGGIPNLPDRLTRDAYCREVSSAGFWAGGAGGPIPYPAFYSYAYPEPAGFARASVKPSAAFYSSELREFILPYDAVRESESPDETLLDFLQTTYEAAAELGAWDRSALEYERDIKDAA
jgi:Family of unknown function (DUF5996)